MNGGFFLWGDDNPWDDGGWSVPALDRREMIGGPLDGCLWRELDPATNMDHYWQPWHGADFIYLPPLVWADELPKPSRDESPAYYFGSALFLGALCGILMLILTGGL